MSDMEDVKDELNEEVKEEIIEDCSNSDVVTKYKLAAEIVNFALQGVITQCKPGNTVYSLCKFGDSIIVKRCATVFKSKKIDKGIAFPTCASVNEIVCHHSPLPGETATLKAGDWVKIDMGCHIDGFIAVAAHTICVGAENESEEGKSKESTEIMDGPAADVLLAAHTAAEVCSKLIKPGNKNTQVTAALEKVAEDFKVKPVQGTIMHQMKRFVIDGNKKIVQKSDSEDKVEEIEFEANETYSVDICFTTGDEKPHESAERTTVFKRVVDKNYRLKMKASRYIFTEINTKYPTLPFSIGSFEDERQARMGVVECVKHELLQSYPVLHLRSGDYIAHIKFTVLLLPSGTTKITGISLPLESLKSDKIVSDEIKAILATSSKNKKKKKKSVNKTTTEKDE